MMDLCYCWKAEFLDSKDFMHTRVTSYKNSDCNPVRLPFEEVAQFQMISISNGEVEKVDK